MVAPKIQQKEKSVTQSRREWIATTRHITEPVYISKWIWLSTRVYGSPVEVISWAAAIVIPSLINSVSSYKAYPQRNYACQRRVRDMRNRFSEGFLVRIGQLLYIDDYCVSSF